MNRTARIARPLPRLFAASALAVGIAVALYAAPSRAWYAPEPYRPHTSWTTQATSEVHSRYLDIRVIDRDTGQSLPVYRSRGEYWVAARPGARYGVSLANRSGERILTVLSVDGVNAITGQTASWQQSGYVLDPFQRHEINGWRKNSHEVAAFEFVPSAFSYATMTGRPDNVGVIGVAVFREAYRPPYWSYHGPDRYKSAPGPAEGLKRDRGAGPQMGTGHGEREWSPSQQTTFERASSRPDEVIRIRYDSFDNLVAAGIVPTHRHRPWRERPEPFPALGYVPDPPRYRW